MDMSRDDPQVNTDPEAIRVWCNLVFGYLSGLVPVRLISEKGTPAQQPISHFVKVEDLAARLVAQSAKAARNHLAVFVVPGTVAVPGSARAEDIRQTGVILADLDEGDIGATRDHLVHYIGLPSLEVASGGKTADGQHKRHLFWRLTEAAEGADLNVVAELRDILARKTGGDKSFASVHQPIRVAGTVHGKQGILSPVRIVANSPVEYDLTEIGEAIRAMPPRPGTKSPFEFDDAKPQGPSAADLMTKPIREGGQDEETRFMALSKVIGHWLRVVRAGRCTLAEAWAAVREHNAAMIRPPWDEAKLYRSFLGILAKDIKANGPMPDEGTANEADKDVVAPAASDDFLAGRFTKLHGQDWKHVAVWGAWLTWNGTRWTREETGAVFNAVRLVCRSEAAAVDKPVEARRLASSKTMQAVHRIVTSDPVIARAPDAFDQHPMLLNTPSGILDLGTGDLQSHARNLFLTQITRAGPGTACPRWMSFLTTVTGGDIELQAYLARLAGYCLSGSTKEQAFFLLHGSGANGKSVFLQTLAWVLGDYAATAAADTFSSRGQTRHLSELAGLRAARLVLVSETEAREGWAEARIKQVTGGEKLRANFMYRDHFEFTPQFKLLVASNHRPVLNEVGESMRRRLHLIPFTVTIPPDKRDPDLAELLKAEADGILGWMIAGCAEWQMYGLKPPRCVQEAGEDYFETEDQIGQWLGDCCLIGPEHRAAATALFGSWAEWAKANGLDPRSSRILGEQLRVRGFRAMRSRLRRSWEGLALRSSFCGEASE